MKSEISIHKFLTTTECPPHNKFMCGYLSNVFQSILSSKQSKKRGEGFQKGGVAMAPINFVRRWFIRKLTSFAILTNLPLPGVSISRGWGSIVNLFSPPSIFCEVYFLELSFTNGLPVSVFIEKKNQNWPLLVWKMNLTLPTTFYWIYPTVPSWDILLVCSWEIEKCFK